MNYFSAVQLYLDTSSFMVFIYFKCFFVLFFAPMTFILNDEK